LNHKTIKIKGRLVEMNKLPTKQRMQTYLGLSRCDHRVRHSDLPVEKYFEN